MTTLATILPPAALLTAFPQTSSQLAPTEPPASPCRFCGTPLDFTFVDLGTSPLCQEHVRPYRYNQAEAFYPLHARVCRGCFLVQLDEFASSAEIFQNDYAYFSSYSASWLRHARRYTEQVTQRFGLTSRSQVVEVASNDGYLLQYFVEKGIPVLGVEPAANVAAHAEAQGIPTLVRFFGRETARYVASTTGQADLLLGNNVLAHVPDINDFVAGMKLLLKPDGVITMEFPHLLRLVEGNQFDTIYHEHFSYLSVHSVQAAAAGHGLDLVRVEELPTHGGSNRYWLRQAGQQTPDGSVADQLAVERAGGLFEPDRWHAFAQTSGQAVADLRAWLVERETSGRTVVAYGAAAKGNTFLNAVGEAAATLEFVVDGSAEKQGRFLPGSHVPVVAPEVLAAAEVDDVLILPWNIGDELRSMVWELSPEAECWVALPTMTRLP